MIDDKTGGYLIPETAVVDVRRSGFIFSLIRWVGNKIIQIGSAVNSLGYKKKIIYPRKSLLEIVKNT